MPTPIIHTAEFHEGYRITSTGDDLLIETTDHHPFPLRLSREQLSSFGLHYKDDHYIPIIEPAADTNEQPDGIVDAMLASLQNVIGLVERQQDASKWKWDLVNLRRALIILGGLDEAVVQRILNEERI